MIIQPEEDDVQIDTTTHASGSRSLATNTELSVHSVVTELPMTTSESNVNNEENEDSKNEKGGWGWELPDWLTLPEWSDYDYDYAQNDTDTCVDYGQNITADDGNGCILQQPMVNAVKVSPHAHDHDKDDYCFHELQKKMKYESLLFCLILIAGVLACSIIAGVLTIIILLIQLIIKTFQYVWTLFNVLKQATSAMW